MKGAQERTEAFNANGFGPNLTDTRFTRPELLRGTNTRKSRFSFDERRKEKKIVDDVDHVSTKSLRNNLIPESNPKRHKGEETEKKAMPF